MDLQQFFSIYRNRIQHFFEETLSNRLKTAKELQDAMMYMLLGGGKRLRPMLVYASGLAFSANENDLDRIAASLEMIHVYSLIHDDLPALDNDDLRHGRPSCHKQFNEPIAIICGDALQSLAFEILSSKMHLVPPERQLQLIYTLSQAIGDLGMAAGQILDMEAEQKQIDIDELENIHKLKTGALLSSSIELGALAGKINLNDEMPHLKNFAHHLGIMFQIQDDILDITSTTEKLGKPQGSDLINEKSTYPSLLGLETSINLAWQHFHKAEEALAHLSNYDTSLLKKILVFMIERDH